MKTNSATFDTVYHTYTSTVRVERRDFLDASLLELFA